MTLAVTFCGQFTAQAAEQAYKMTTSREYLKIENLQIRSSQGLSDLREKKSFFHQCYVKCHD